MDLNVSPPLLLKKKEELQLRFKELKDTPIKIYNGFQLIWLVFISDRAQSRRAEEI